MIAKPPNQKQMAEAIWREYEQLSEWDKEIIQKREIKGMRTLSEWLQLIQKLAKFDAQLEEYLSYFPKKAKGCLQNFLVGLMFITFFASLVMLNPAPFIFALLLYLLNAGCRKATGQEKLEKIYQLDLPNYLKNCIYPFLQILQEDVQPDKLISLKVDMRSPLDKFWRKVNSVSKRNETTYEYTFLEIEGSLQDKTKFFLRAFAQVRERRKYHYKGDKYKMRLRIIIQSTFVFSADKYLSKIHTLYTEESKLHKLRLQKISLEPPTIVPDEPRLRVRQATGKYLVHIKKIEPLYQTKNPMKNNRALEYFYIEEYFTTRFPFSPQLLLEGFAKAYSLFELKKK
ncbi:MAG: hypothetical protein NZ551_10065 [Microscillaceae bacterium]|nr:hypothetical protein [Microscillaceae bacterium]MDW8461541.1 hypothetical protein [Cytophagales bacterium]